MDYLCEVQFNSQVRLQTQGGLSCGRLRSQEDGDTSAQRKPQVHHRTPR